VKMKISFNPIPRNDSKRSKTDSITLVSKIRFMGNLVN
jgi:hypothetical protein